MPKLSKPKSERLATAEWFEQEERRKIASGKAIYMYRVERFRPRYCPGCCQRFEYQATSRKRGPGGWIFSSRRPQNPNGTLLDKIDSVAIRCMECANVTAIFDYESYTLRSKRKAEAMLEKGFFNLQRVLAVGNAQRDSYTHGNGTVEFIGRKPSRPKRRNGKTSKTRKAG